MPTGKKDEYYIFASGGQSGNVDRHRRAVDAPPQGDRRLHARAVAGLRLRRRQRQGPRGRQRRAATRSRWADVHHPNLSRDEGRLRRPVPLRERQGERARRGRRSHRLHDQADRRRTRSSRATTAAPSSRRTPTTSSRRRQYPAPLGREYAPLDAVQGRSTAASRCSGSSTARRGASTRRRAGRSSCRRTRRTSPTPASSAATAGRSSTRSTPRWRPAARSRASRRSSRGASQNDMDYLHVINWKKAEAARHRRQDDDDHRHARPAARRDRGAEGVLTLVGEPKSPHGCDVTPDGKAIVVGGKLDTHTTVYELREDQGADRRRRSSRARTPTASRSCRSRTRSAARSRSASARCTRCSTTRATPTRRVFIESTVAKWSLKDLKRRSRSSRSTTTSATSSRPRATPSSPDGKYVVAMNKMSIDRFHAGRPALSAELPAHRHHGREDAAALRHADRHRRAALRADDQGRQAQADQDLPAGHQPVTGADRSRSRSRAARSASSATATRSTST